MPFLFSGFKTFMGSTIGRGLVAGLAAAAPTLFNRVGKPLIMDLANKLGVGRLAESAINMAINYVQSSQAGGLLAKRPSDTELIPPSARKRRKRN